MRGGGQRNLFPGRVHEGLHLFQSELAILVAVHCLENSFVGSLTSYRFEANQYACVGNATLRPRPRQEARD